MTVKQTLLDLFTSKKFLVALTAIIVYVGGRFGFHIDPTALDRIWQALLVYVGAQGIADLGKSAAALHVAARATALDPAIEPTSVVTARSIGGAAALLLVALVGAGVVLAPACGSRQRGASAAGTFIDCEAPDLAQLLPDLIPIAREAVMAAVNGDGSIDTAQLRADAAAIRGDLGKCVLAAAIAALSTPTRAEAPLTAALALDAAQLRGAFVSVRGDLGWAPVHVAGTVL